MKVKSRTVPGILYNFASRRQSAWLSLLPTVELVFNSSTKPATRLSPFEAAFGRKLTPSFSRQSTATSDLPTSTPVPPTAPEALGNKSKWTKSITSQPKQSTQPRSARTLDLDPNSTSFPSNQTVTDHEDRIVRLERTLRDLVAKTEHARPFSDPSESLLSKSPTPPPSFPSLLPSPPFGSFRYSLQRGLEPLIPRNTARSLAASWRKTQPHSPATAPAPRNTRCQTPAPRRASSSRPLPATSRPSLLLPPPPVPSLRRTPSCSSSSATCLPCPPPTASCNSLLPSSPLSPPAVPTAGRSPASSTPTPPSEHPHPYTQTTEFLPDHSLSSASSPALSSPHISHPSPTASAVPNAKMKLHLTTTSSTSCSSPQPSPPASLTSSSSTCSLDLPIHIPAIHYSLSSFSPVHSATSTILPVSLLLSTPSNPATESTFCSVPTSPLSTCPLTTCRLSRKKTCGRQYFLLSFSKT
ncbi:hypothetical protein PTTG_30283 [Puccinia triticina 1-1 BBBD Race 1]|uniref:Uncharacterized protein n=1 Tax=Puccinia triticina (isolate 1-1 / race 1 (BBBD)) TaxID=630390 RepID=A0A180FZP7_PUCT1|nr:hypothetical protein PTTG_30283 [Puccinia triticina 1-1 BBBD Race 1]